jgi:hypothetical protein
MVNAMSTEVGTWIQVHDITLALWPYTRETRLPSVFLNTSQDVHIESAVKH